MHKCALAHFTFARDFGFFFLNDLDFLNLSIFDRLRFLETYQKTLIHFSIESRFCCSEFYDVSLFTQILRIADVVIFFSPQVPL